jgi:hypothetical protein
MKGYVTRVGRSMMVEALARPDQLDQQVAMAINQIRRDCNWSRVNVLHLPQKRYKTITADMVVRLEP